MTFRFKFAAVENHRRLLKDLARKEYLEAKAAVDRKLDEIDGYYNSIDEARARAEHLQKQPQATSAPLIQIEEFITGQLKRIEKARFEVRELMAVAEEKHEALVEAMTAHKAMVKLRERHFREFKTALKKQQQKEVDDLMTSRFKLRGSL